MYNRYIPQPDGSYRRRQVQEPFRSTHPQTENHHPPQIPLPSPEEHCPEEQPEKQEKHCGRPKPQNQRLHGRKTIPAKSPPQKEESSLTDFFHKLIPKDFDTGDLLIILLLLLMSGDCQEDQNSALLTLAIYMFM